MVRLPRGNVRLSAGWIAIILGGLWSVGIAAPLSHSARADDLNGAMDRFAGRIKQLLDAERESSIALNQFRAPARMAASSSSGIRKALEEALKKRDVSIRRNARLEMSGEYREIEDPRDRKTVVRFLGHIVDQATGRPVSECEVKVDNVTSIAVLVGATMELPPTPVTEDREQSIRDGLRKPSAHVAANRISADSRSPFAIEILTGPAGCSDPELRPRAAAIDEGHATMKIRTDERYAVMLINDATFDVAVTLAIDGLSMFAFSENKDYSYVFVPQHSRALITGWHRTNEDAEKFVVTDYARSAAASQSLAPSSDLGVITACFAAAWPVKGNPPPDEGMEGHSARATSRGPITRTEFVEVDRKTGKLRASISVRYTKERE
jgi:hypothetical protein